MKSLRRVMPAIKKLQEQALSKEVLDDIKVTGSDFREAMKNVEPSAMREVIVDIPKVKWNDVGGLEGVKQELRESIELPLKNPELFQNVGVEPARGILLYGPSGTGKTLLAKAVANESESNFIVIKGPELLNKYVGESERGVRKIFKRARQVSPSIIFFDEIDSLAGTRGFQMDSSGVKEGVVAQLLSEIDGVSELKNVVLIGSTNRPDLLDQSLLRPGRFEKLIFVPPPDEESRKEIFKVHSKKLNLSTGINFSSLAKRTEKYTGADIEAICREAGMAAIREALKKGKKDNKVSKEDFEKALKKIKPSLKEKDLKEWEGIKETLKVA